jgi:hypothetical protein
LSKDSGTGIINIQYAYDRRAGSKNWKDLKLGNIKMKRGGNVFTSFFLGKSLL